MKIYYLDGDGTLGTGVILVHQGIVGEHHHVCLDLLPRREMRWRAASHRASAAEGAISADVGPQTVAGAMQRYA